MTNKPNPQLRERARHALERSLRPAARPSNEPPDPALLARLETALHSLPPRRREIFLAVRLGAMTCSEIAQRTGLSVAQVERELARAIARIDRCLEQGDASPPRPWLRSCCRRFLRR